MRAMFVRADWTRRGLGRRIIEACEAAARARASAISRSWRRCPACPSTSPRLSRSRSSRSSCRTASRSTASRWRSRSRRPDRAAKRFPIARGGHHLSMSAYTKQNLTGSRTRRPTSGSPSSRRALRAGLSRARSSDSACSGSPQLPDPVRPQARGQEEVYVVTAARPGSRSRTRSSSSASGTRSGSTRTRCETSRPGPTASSTWRSAPATTHRGRDGAGLVERLSRRHRPGRGPRAPNHARRARAAATRRTA